MVPWMCSKGILTAGRWRLAQKELDKEFTSASRYSTAAGTERFPDKSRTARVDPLHEDGFNSKNVIVPSYAGASEIGLEGYEA
jgi:hypothetical protein